MDPHHGYISYTTFMVHPPLTHPDADTQGTRNVSSRLGAPYSRRGGRVLITWNFVTIPSSFTNCYLRQLPQTTFGQVKTSFWTSHHGTFYLDTEWTCLDPFIVECNKSSRVLRDAQVGILDKPVWPRPDEGHG